MEEINVGEKVYYKKDKEDKWKGPAKVIGKEGKTVVVKYDSDVRETNRSQEIKVRKMGDYFENHEINGNSEHDENEREHDKEEESEGEEEMIKMVERREVDSETEDGETEEEDEEERFRSNEEEIEDVDESEGERRELKEEDKRKKENKIKLKEKYALKNKDNDRMKKVRILSRAGMARSKNGRKIITWRMWIREKCIG